MSRIRRLHGGRDRLRARDWNALVDSHERNVLAPHSEPYMIGGTPVGRHIEQLPMRGHRFHRFRGNDPDAFLAVLWNEGPSSEADYEDERYWVREVALPNTSSGDATQQIGPKFVTSGKWVTATNLNEIYATGTSGRIYGHHGLGWNTDGRCFPVWAVWDNRSGQKVKHYVFSLSTRAKFFAYDTSGQTITGTDEAVIIGSTADITTTGALENVAASNTDVDILQHGYYELTYTIDFQTAGGGDSYSDLRVRVYNVDTSGFYSGSSKTSTSLNVADVGAAAYAIVTNTILFYVNATQGQIHLAATKTGSNADIDSVTLLIQQVF